MTQTILLNLPDALINRAKELAAQTQRTVEAEIVEAVAKGLAESDELSPDHVQALASLELLDDKALWRVAYSHLPKKSSAKIERLHRKRSLEGLTSAETESLQALLHQYERYMLVRAKAVALLKEHGHDVSVILKQP